jgi:hypothetical protein
VIAAKTTAYTYGFYVNRLLMWQWKLVEASSSHHVQGRCP